MSNIDMQRIVAIRKLEKLGYSYAFGDWHAPAAMTAATPRQPTPMRCMRSWSSAPTPWRDAQWDSS